MREADVLELAAGGFSDTRAAVETSIASSTACWAARVNGELAAIFGVAPIGTLMGGVGAPWLLGTPAVPRHRRVLAACARPYIHVMLRAYPHLQNLVHAKNTVAVAWLKRMGFVLHAPQALPPLGEMFHLFEMRPCADQWR